MSGYSEKMIVGLLKSKTNKQTKQKENSLHRQNKHQNQKWQGVGII